MMNENIKIRLAEIKDIHKIVTLVRTSFNNLYLTTSIYSSFGIEKFINEEMENENSPYKYFIAEINNEVVGFVEFKVFYDTSTAFLNMIATDNNFKGKGIAHQLFVYTKDLFSGLNLKNLQLDVFDSNSIAKKWYYSLGFQQENVKNFYKYSSNDFNNDIRNENIVITNYPHFKYIYNCFGFSFLQITMNQFNLNLGVINSNGIVRGASIDSLGYKNLSFLLKKKNITNLYYIGESYHNSDLEKIDEIVRMKLNI